MGGNSESLSRMAAVACALAVAAALVWSVLAAPSRPQPAAARIETEMRERAVRSMRAAIVEADAEGDAAAVACYTPILRRLERGAD